MESIPNLIYYAGIGSRNTPEDVLVEMRRVAAWLAEKGFVLRSGAAEGADSAFEAGADTVKGLKEIYLPWRGFNGHSSELYNLSQEAYTLASQTHPAWFRLGQGAQKLHTRNCYQILGDALRTPVKFVLYWKDNNRTSGTDQALRLARSLNIAYYKITADKEKNDALIKILLHSVTSGSI